MSECQSLSETLDGVTNIIKRNVAGLLVRGEKVEDLIGKSEDLEAGVSRNCHRSVSGLDCMSPLHTTFLYNTVTYTHSLM